MPSVLRRLRAKTTTPIDRSFAVAWRIYIRGRIVSGHSKRIISQFMAASCGKSKTEDTTTPDISFAPSMEQKNEPCSLSLQSVHQVLRSASDPKKRDRKKDGGDEGVEDLNVSEQIKCSLRLGFALWSLEGTCWSNDAVGVEGHRAFIPPSTSAKASGKVKQTVQMPELVYTRLYERSCDAWFRRIQRERITPNAEQLAYLQDIRNRCAIEAQELKVNALHSKKTHLSEPYRKCLLGPPGTGKSECLRWTRRFFEEVLNGHIFTRTLRRHSERKNS